jgi:hypothetical protein
MLESGTASFPLARSIRTDEGAPIGEVFSFVSGLYFRGKLAYARRFAKPPRGRADQGVLIITPEDGLWTPGRRMGVDRLGRFAGVAVDSGNPAFRRPLEKSAEDLAADLGGRSDVVLLGSIASKKYVDVLGPIFGQQLLFPRDFVGRGDMSRGALMLRSVEEGRELEYASVVGSTRRGARAPRLGPPR